MYEFVHDVHFNDVQIRSFDLQPDMPFKMFMKRISALARRMGRLRVFAMAF